MPNFIACLGVVMSTFRPLDQNVARIREAWTPERSLISVVLPAPLSPTSPTISPLEQLEVDVFERVHARVPFVQASGFEDQRRAPSLRSPA